MAEKNNAIANKVLAYIIAPVLVLGIGGGAAFAMSTTKTLTSLSEAKKGHGEAIRLIRTNTKDAIGDVDDKLEKMAAQLVSIEKSLAFMAGERKAKR